MEYLRPSKLSSTRISFKVSRFSVAISRVSRKKFFSRSSLAW